MIPCLLPQRLACLAAACILSLAAIAPATAAADNAPELLTLANALSIASADSGLVSASQAQAQAAREMAVTAGRLPDPVLKLGVNNLPVTGPDRFSLTRDFMTMRSIGLMQEFSSAAKRRARAELAEREVALAEVGREQVGADLRRDVALAWLDRSFQESARELLALQLVQAGLQVQAAETLYRSGKGSQVEVFAARAEVEKLRDRIDETEREIALATTRLERWVGTAAHAPLAPRPPLSRPAWSQAEAASVSSHPVVAAAQQQEAMAQAEMRLADANRRPDWSLELMYSQRGPDYSNMASLNLSLPLQWDQKNRQDRELQARHAMVQQARSRREDLERAYRAELQAALQAWASHEQRQRRYDESLLPLARQRSASALSAYAAGSGSLPAVIDARRSLLELQLERLRLEMDLARLWAQLNFVVPAQGAQP